MPQLATNDTLGVQIVVNETPGRNFGGDVPPYTVSISDPSNTITLNTAINVITPNGTNNTGTVTVTVTLQDGSGLSVQETLNVVPPGAGNSLHVDFVPAPIP